MQQDYVRVLLGHSIEFNADKVSAFYTGKENVQTMLSVIPVITGENGPNSHNPTLAFVIRHLGMKPHPDIYIRILRLGNPPK